MTTAGVSFCGLRPGRTGMGREAEVIELVDDIGVSGGDRRWSDTLESEL